MPSGNKSVTAPPVEALAGRPVPPCPNGLDGAAVGPAPCSSYLLALERRPMEGTDRKSQHAGDLPLSLLMSNFDKFCRLPRSD